MLRWRWRTSLDGRLSRLRRTRSRLGSTARPMTAGPVDELRVLKKLIAYIIRKVPPRGQSNFLNSMFKPRRRPSWRTSSHDLPYSLDSAKPIKLNEDVLNHSNSYAEAQLLQFIAASTRSMRGAPSWLASFRASWVKTAVVRSRPRSACPTIAPRESRTTDGPKLPLWRLHWNKTGISRGRRSHDSNTINATVAASADHVDVCKG